MLRTGGSGEEVMCLEPRASWPRKRGSRWELSAQTAVTARPCWARKGPESTSWPPSFHSADSCWCLPWAKPKVSYRSPKKLLHYPCNKFYTYKFLSRLCKDKFVSSFPTSSIIFQSLVHIIQLHLTFLLYSERPSHQLSPVSRPVLDMLFLCLKHHSPRSQFSFLPHVILEKPPPDTNINGLAPT